MKTNSTSKSSKKRSGQKKSSNAKKSTEHALSPEQAIEFLESFRDMVAGIDEKTSPISLRVPGNILRAYKLKAKSEGRS